MHIMLLNMIIWFLLCLLIWSYYAYYAYPSALGDLTSITSGGFESLNAFDKLVRDFTNAQGKAVSYNIYVQKNGGTENVSIIIN